MINEALKEKSIENLIKKVLSLKEEERVQLLSQITENLKDFKEIPYDFFNILTDFKKKTASNKAFCFYAGVDFARLKAMVRKNINMLDNTNTNTNNISDDKDYVGIEEIKKMSLKERFEYKEAQKEINTKFNLYEDIKEYIKEEINNRKATKKLLAKTDLSNLENKNPDEIFNTIAIQEVNDILFNNILNNKNIYLALVIVRIERLENLYEKFAELNKNF